jgi:hypothetical protein
MTRCRLIPPGVGVHSNPFSVVKPPRVVVAGRGLHDPPPDRPGRLRHVLVRRPDVQPGWIGTDHTGNDHLHHVLDVAGPAVNLAERTAAIRAALRSPQ